LISDAYDSEVDSIDHRCMQPHRGPLWTWGRAHDVPVLFRAGEVCTLFGPSSGSLLPRCPGSRSGSRFSASLSCALSRSATSGVITNASQTVKSDTPRLITVCHHQVRRRRIPVPGRQRLESARTSRPRLRTEAANRHVKGTPARVVACSPAVIPVPSEAMTSATRRYAVTFVHL
jgi:hypothetical protein